jgi:hypothetical protein
LPAESETVTDGTRQGPEIQIDPRLYRELRAFCDQVGIRFADFVADALETARDRYRTEEQAREMRDLARRLEDVRREGFRRGWRYGAWLGFWAARGELGLGLLARTPGSEQGDAEFRLVDGGQMSLFDCNATDGGR